MKVFYYVVLASIFLLGTASAADTDSAAPDLAQLKAQIAAQQAQIEQLKQVLADQASVLNRLETKANAAGPQFPVSSQVASTSPVVPPMPDPAPRPNPFEMLVPDPSPQQVAAANTDALQRAIDGINNNLRGFRFSGDFRFRFDSLTRAANTDLPPGDNRAVPQQRDRSRYRVRFNIDKDLFFRDGGPPLAHFHLQLATDPYNNPITMDTDYAGVVTRAPFSIAEAYMDFNPLKGLSFRIGRTPELFADNRQFVYDDDIRFNGFHETYRYTAKNSAFFQLAAAQYILTDPNTQVVPAGSPYLTAGYKQGQRVPSADLFDQGVTFGSNLGKKWSHNETVNYFIVREPNQIALASTANGAALFQNSPVVGATLISALGGTGNATTTAGGAIYYASDFHVVKYGFNLNYSGSMLMNHNFPFTVFAQGTHNTGSNIYNNGYMLGTAFGQTARLGDMQFQYQYFYKPANAFISQFSDDDVGTGSGVNVKTHQVRLNFGLTRFLVWENRLYIQKGVAYNNPSINFFVPLQRGYNTQFRLHSQLVFTF